MAAMLNGAGALAFAARLLGASPDTLEREAAEGYRGPGALIFLPYLSGERTPLDDPYARGVLFGMSETTSRGDVARAVMEGVALTLAEARDCLAAAGATIDRVGLIGGGAKSALWTHMIAAATSFTVVRMKGGETGPAYGAARLARMAATGEPPDAVCTPPDVADVTEPDPALAEAFERQRERFKALYGAVKGEFRRGGQGPDGALPTLAFGDALSGRRGRRRESAGCAASEPLGLADHRRVQRAVAEGAGGGALDVGHRHRGDLRGCARRASRGARPSSWICTSWAAILTDVSKRSG